MDSPRDLTLPISQDGTSKDTQGLPVRARGAYEVQGELARGGLGRVLCAKDLNLGRIVAIKEVLKDNPAAKERFLREALLTARLQHPSIVPIYEAGQWPSGEPFYSMKLISGKPLSDAITERADLEKRLSLLPALLSACEAIAYAHSKRVIHRDLKPQNILLGEFGETIVIDWGLAKELLPDTVSSLNQAPAETPEETNLTQAGSILGTPAYMPPEQAKGLPVDERADVYALGAIFYFLLTGEPPYQGRYAQEVIDKVVKKPPVPLLEKQKGIPQDLVAIVQKAMARDVDERYASAKELTDDLKKYLNGQLVGAHQYSTTELFRRWFRRHRGAVAASVVLLLAGIGSVSYGFYKSDQERRVALSLQALAESREIEANRQKKEAEELRLAAEEQRLTATKQADALALVSARTLLAQNPRRALEILEKLSPDFQNWSGARVMVSEALSRASSMILSDFAWKELAYNEEKKRLVYPSSDHTIHLWELSCLLGEDPSCVSHFTLTGHGSAITYVGFGPRDLPEAPLLSAEKEGTIWAWDLSTKEGIPLHGHTDVIKWLTLSPDGTYLASGSRDKTVRLWDLRSGQGSIIAKHEAEITRVFFSPDGKVIVSASLDGQLQSTNIDTKENKLLIVTSPMESGVGLLPDRKTLLADTPEGTLRLFDLTTGKERDLVGHQKQLTGGLVTKDGKSMISADESGLVLLWDLTSYTHKPLVGHTGPVFGLFLSPDQKKLITAEQGKLFLWDVTTGALLGKRENSEFPWHRFSSDSKLVAYPGTENTAHIWNTETNEDRVLLGHQNQVVRLEFSPSGRYLATGGFDNIIRVWDTKQHSSTARWVLYGHEDDIEAFRWIDDETLLSGSADRTVRIWKISAQEEETLTDANPEALISYNPQKDAIAYLTSEGALKSCLLLPALSCRTLAEKLAAPLSVSFSPDASLIAVAAQSEILLFPTSGEKALTLSGHQGSVWSLAFSPDGKMLASMSRDKTIKLWDVASQKLIHTFPLWDTSPKKLLFSSDGRLLFTAERWSLGREGMRAPQSSLLWAFDTQTGKSRGFPGHENLLMDLSLSPDGKRLASSGADFSIRLWEVGCFLQNLEAPQSEEVLCQEKVFLGHRGRVYETKFSPDGKILASAGDDNVLRLWDVATEKELRVLQGHEHSVVSVAFSPDGLSIVSGGLDSFVRIWDVSSGENRVLQGHEKAINGALFTKNGAHVISFGMDGAIRVWPDSLPQTPEGIRQAIKEGLERYQDVP